MIWPPRLEADQVVGRALDELVEVGREPVGEVIDGDLAPFVDPAMQRFAVVDEDLGDLDVEMPRPVGPVGEPAFRLLGQAVDQDQGGRASVVAEAMQVEQFADAGVHGCCKLRGAEAVASRRRQDRAFVPRPGLGTPPPFTLAT